MQDMERIIFQFLLRIKITGIRTEQRDVYSE